MPRQKSRSARRDDVVTDLGFWQSGLEEEQGLASEVEGKIEELEEQYNDWLEECEGLKDDEKPEEPRYDDYTLDQLKEQLQTHLGNAESLMSEFDYSEVEELKDEMENWRDNMSGTNLENTEKYSRVDEAVTYLEEAVSACQCVYDSFEDSDQIQETIDSIQEAIDALESVEFPGMYG